jgi:hypothetical protein
MAIWSILLLLEIFYGHLVYFVAIWYIFAPFWYFVPRKIWQPCTKRVSSQRGLMQVEENVIQVSTKKKEKKD